MKLGTCRSDLVGAKFGRLTVVHRAPSDSRKNPRWTCRCACGAERTVYQFNLTGKTKTRSCGCLQKEAVREHNTTHGMTDSPAHNSWTGMLGRCRNRNDTRWVDYGGRGIRVCDRWLSFEAFLADMGPAPSPSHSIDRVDNDGDYEPGNCRWSTPKEQQRNRRVNRVIEYRGERRCLAEWSELLGINYGTMAARLKRGWSVDDALSRPPQPGRKP